MAYLRMVIIVFYFNVRLWDFWPLAISKFDWSQTNYYLLHDFEPEQDRVRTEFEHLEEHHCLLENVFYFIVGLRDLRPLAISKIGWSQSNYSLLLATWIHLNWLIHFVSGTLCIRNISCLEDFAIRILCNTLHPEHFASGTLHVWNTLHLEHFASEQFAFKTLCIWNNFCLEHFASGTIHIWNTSYLEQFAFRTVCIQNKQFMFRTLHIWNTLHSEHFVFGTLLLLLFKFYIIFWICFIFVIFIKFCDFCDFIWFFVIYFIFWYILYSDIFYFLIFLDFILFLLILL